MDLTDPGTPQPEAAGSQESAAERPQVRKRRPRRDPQEMADAATGSKLLGEFLRKLRGSRSLQVIEDLSKSPPLAGRIRPVDVSTLSKIETGKQFPSLTTLLSLEQIYEVPIQRFLDHVKLEKYWELRPQAEEFATAIDEGTAAADTGEYPRAYAAFLLAESLAPADDERFRARNNKASMLWKMGMLQEAISEYCDLLGDLSLPVGEQLKVLHNLAAVYHSKGNLYEARLHAQEGLRMAEQLANKRSQAFLLRVLGALLDDRHERSKEPDDRVLREALRHYEKALALFVAEDLPLQVAVTKTNIGSTYCRLGNFIVGLKHLRDGLTESERHGDRRSTAHALKELGRAYFLTRNYSKAKDSLFDCERISERNGYVDLLFMCYFYLREIELAHGGAGMHESKRLMRLRALQERSFWELEQFEKQLQESKEVAG
jgi:tetratricopeptide (TPR) repeat protein